MRAKLIFFTLVGVNVLLFCAILITAQRRFGTEKNARLPQLVKPDSFLPEFAVAEPALGTAENRTRYKFIAFIFLEDSVRKRSEGFQSDFSSRCRGKNDGDFLLAFVLRDNDELSGNTDPRGSPCMVYVKDSGEMLRKRAGVRREACVIVRAGSRLVTESYSYVPNPFVLCEQLERLRQIDRQ